MIEQTVKKLFNIFGLDIIKKQKVDKVTLKLLKLLNNNDINYIIDVGANEGQYATKLLEAGFDGNIFSIEPLSGVYDTLKERTQNWKKWTISDRFALGGKNYSTEIHIAGNLQSSSILNMCESHINCAPSTKYIGRETINVRRMDDVISKDELINKKVFLKIDSQGFELHILEGAGDLLNSILGIQLELSIIELYENQVLYKELISYVESKGFYLKQIFTGMLNNKTGELYQFDGIFFRNKE